MAPPFQLNVTALVPNVGVALRSIFAWKLGSVGTTFAPLPAPEIQAIADTILPPRVGPAQHSLPQPAQSASSGALVPVASLPNPERIAYTIGALNEQGAMNERISFERLPHVIATDVQALAQAGVVSLAESEFGELVVSLCREAVTPTAAYGVCTPMPA